MHHSAALILNLPGDAVLRTPSSWERIKRLFLPSSMAPDLSTEECELDQNVVSLTEGICAALREIDVTDAVYLAVDGHAVYHDMAGVPNDAERLLEAAQHDSLRGPFQELRAVFMQRQDGLELLYEATFQRRFLRDTPAAFIAVSGRIGALRPQPGEPSEAAQARLHTLLGDRELLPSLHAFFEERVQKLEASLRRSFPEGSVSRRATATFVRRPSKESIRRLSRRGLQDPQPSLRAQPGCYHPAGNAHPYYDPWDCYFLDDGQIWIDLAALDELVEGSWQPLKELAVDVVDSAGALLCHGSEALGQGGLLSEIISAAAQRDISMIDYFVPRSHSASDGDGDGDHDHAHDHAHDHDPFDSAQLADPPAPPAVEIHVDQFFVTSTDVPSAPMSIEPELPIMSPSVINLDSPMPGIVLPDDHSAMPLLESAYEPGIVQTAVTQTIGDIIGDILSAIIAGGSGYSSDD